MTELERRTPPELNPWAGCAVLALHSHAAEQDCTAECTEYDRRESATE